MQCEVNYLLDEADIVFRLAVCLSAKKKLRKKTIDQKMMRISVNNTFIRANRRSDWMLVTSVRDI